MQCYLIKKDETSSTVTYWYYPYFVEDLETSKEYGIIEVNKNTKTWKIKKRAPVDLDNNVSLYAGVAVSGISDMIRKGKYLDRDYVAWG